jgi:DNA-directed RNA polymerase subunit RPC12/RpoP
MSQLRVWVRDCAKCGKRFTTTDESHNVLNWYLCGKCGKLWLLFFDENYKRLREKYPQFINPSYQIFVGELTDKEKVQFT